MSTVFLHRCFPELSRQIGSSVHPSHASGVYVSFDEGYTTHLRSSAGRRAASYMTKSIKERQGKINNIPPPPLLLPFGASDIPVTAAGTNPAPAPF